MDAKEALLDYFHNTVKPTVDEFIQSPTDVRRARLAAIALEHINDYANRYDGENNKDRAMKKLFEACPDAKHVRDAANASKHASLKSYSENNSLKRMSTTADQMKSSNHPGVFQAGFNFGVFAEANYVHIWFDEPNHEGVKARNMVEAVQSVLGYWESRIQ